MVRKIIERFFGIFKNLDIFCKKEKLIKKVKKKRKNEKMKK